LVEDQDSAANIFALLLPAACSAPAVVTAWIASLHTWGKPCSHWLVSECCTGESSAWPIREQGWGSLTNGSAVQLTFSLQ